MHIIVVGCGRVGSELGTRLLTQGHTVCVVDKQASALKRLPSDFAGNTVVGFGFDQDALKEAGVEKAGALAAVTSGDNTNILTARVAREMFDVPQVVARIYDPRRAVIYQRLGIPTVATVSWTVDQVVRRLFPDRSATAWTDPSGTVSMVERTLPPGYAGKRLSEMADGNRFRPVMVTRRGEAQLASGDIVGQEGDVILFAARRDAIHDLEERLGGSAEGAAAAGVASAGGAAGGHGGAAGAGAAGGGHGDSRPATAGTETGGRS